MATTIYKQSQYVRWDAQGNVITSSKNIGSSGGTVTDFIALLLNYYTKPQLQTSGLAQVHWDNITNVPADLENTFQYSVVEDSVGVVNLVGDVASPGNNKIYGTDGAGLRGWYNATTLTDYTFVHSIVEESAGHVSLENDTEAPGNSKLYGTNSSGTRGWYDIPVIDSDFTPAAHNTTHQNGGADEISVAGLSGLLADAQTPAAHVLNSATHTVSGLTSGHFLKATGTTSFGFAAHGLTYTDVGAAATAHTHTGTYAPVIHNLIDTTNHPVTGLSTGHFLKATGATTYAFGAHGLTYSSVGAAPTNHQLDSSTYHSVSGLSTGHFLKATSATTFGFAAHGLTYTDVGAAASGHVHTGTYEPVLGNPAGSGYVLSSTTGGVRSWVAPSTGNVNLTGSTNNTVCTVTGANAIQGEANMTFDGTDLTVSGIVYATDHANTSDLRLKTNVVPYISKPINVSYKQFEMKDNLGQIRYGIIAQELQEDYPELVREGKDGILSISYIDLLIRKIAFLEEEIKKLNN